MRPWNRRLTDRLIQPSDFAHRRRRLLDGMRPGSIALVPGAIEQRRAVNLADGRSRFENQTLFSLESGSVAIQVEPFASD